MRDQLAAELEMELTKTREQLTQAENDGAEIALRASKTIEELRAEIKMLKRSEKTAAGGPCLPCHRKRLVFAAFFSGAIAMTWFSDIPPAPDHPQFLPGILMSISPFVIVTARWRWLHFKHRNGWISFRDNDAYRSLQRRWNSMISRVMVR